MTVLHFHLPKFLNNVGPTLDEILPLVGSNKKSMAYDDEYDLTNTGAIRDLTSEIAVVCGQKFNKNLVCVNYWISVTPPGGCVVPHDHLDGGSTGVTACAVLYLQADSGCGDLELVSVGEAVRVAEGDLVLFSADCVHSVPLNSSDRDRICVAFDFIVPQMINR